mmetsp:Transcript_31801/g.36513  ORF Transcript_31801/g.36513 Transcript_31801/m.36513 type:complete len:124 (-) Transcript_31801:22-393(-)
MNILVDEEEIGNTTTVLKITRSAAGVIVMGPHTQKGIEEVIEMKAVEVLVIVEATTTKRGNENVIKKEAEENVTEGTMKAEGIVSTKNDTVSIVVITRKEARKEIIADAVQAALHNIAERNNN